MINVGNDQIASLMVGGMGVKTAAIGDTTVYTRTGGYFYLILDTTEKETNTNG